MFMAKKRCFIISPIGLPDSEIRKHADAVFRGIIMPAVEELHADGLEIEPLRSDHLQEPGKISDQMFREIFQNDLCIAILTYFNPNVLYELAVAQCAYRPVVVLLQEGEKLPFDVADLRIVPYDLADMLRLIDRRDAKELAGHMRTMLGGNSSPPNPFGPSAPAAWAAVRDPRGLQRLIETARPKPLPPGVDGVYRLPEDPHRQIVIRTGDIRHVTNIDVVLSSENTDLQLARYYDPSVSGTLRYLDAERGIDGRVVRDALDERLKMLIRQHDIKLPVMPGTVLAMPTTGLAARGIRYVFLAATVRGDGVGSGYSAVAQGEIENCVRECFQRFDELAQTEQLESILFPVFGAGTARQDPEQTVGFLLPVIVESMRRTPSCKQTYMLAWVESHRAALRKVALRLGLEQEGEPTAS
jgi:O-acetyl-ADP-ribose deacetylase (regulator of RNase III)